MKNKLIALLVGSLGLASVAVGQDYSLQSIGPFGGLNNRDNSVTIPANKAQDLLNVEITPGGMSVKKREGYGEAFELSITTSAVHGVYRFYETAGSDVSLFFNDVNMSASVAGGDATVVMTTGTLDAIYYCVDSQGYAYCANDSNDPIIQTDGETFSTLTSVATGTTLAVLPTRLAQAGFTDYPNRIDFSEEADFTNWTVGGECTDPITFTITAPGTKIVHIVYALDRLLWFKEESFGYILEGPCLGDWVAGTISSTVGTKDNASIYVGGILYFRGQDGHYFLYDGANLARISRDIQTTVDLSQPLRQASWKETTTLDWGDGTYNDNQVYVDTETYADTLSTTFPDPFDSFRDGNNSTKDVWTEFTVSGSGTGDVSVSGGLLKFSLDGNTFEQLSVRTTETIEDFDQGTTFHMVINEFEKSEFFVNRFYITLSSMATTTVNPTLLNSSFEFLFYSTTTGDLYLQQAYDNDTGLVSTWKQPQQFPITLDLYIATTVVQVSMNDISTRCVHAWDNNEIYVYLSFLKGSEGFGTMELDNFNVIPQTMTYISPVHNASGFAEWDSFDASKLETGGSQDFYIRGSTALFTVNSSTPGWVAVLSGDKPSISSGTYFQIKDVFDYTSSALGKLELYDFTANWFEGATGEVHGIYHKDALWWTVASGAGATVNSQIQRYDLLNQGWTLYDIASNGMMVRNQNLYFGDTATGYIYKFGGVNNDNGAAIEAYWKSKDFVMGSPFLEKEVDKLSIAAASVGGSAITVTYTLDGSTSTAYTATLYEAGSTFITDNRNLPVGETGSIFNVQFGNDSVDSPFEIFAIQYGVKPKRWRPTE